MTWGRSSEYPPPMLAVYDRDTAGYRVTNDEICAARHPVTGYGFSKGDLCGNCAWKWAADVPLCRTHYKRLVQWVIQEDEEALDAEVSRQERLHQHELRRQEELNAQEIELDRERVEARANAKGLYSVVYYVRRVSDGMIKIGYTRNLHQRMTAHRGDHGEIEILLVHGGDREEEAEAHYLFRDYRIGNTEWFRPARPLLDWIRRARGRLASVQPGEVLRMKAVKELVQSAPARDVLRWDDNGVLEWPPVIEPPAA